MPVSDYLRMKRPIHELRICCKSLSLHSESVTNFFTRDVVHRVIDRKCYPHSGSCTGEKYAMLNSFTLLPKLAKGNTFPGSMACVKSCNGLGCHCFNLSSGCLSYRVYLKSLTTKVYEVFHCTRWTEEIKVEIAHYDAINRKSSTVITHVSP